MTVDDVISECRVRLDDLVTPYQYADDNLLIWLDDAEMEACRRARLLSDSSLTVAISAGVSAYDIPDSTIQLRRAKLLLDEVPLDFASSRDMDEDVAGWQTHKGTPTDIISDMDSHRFTLYPEPIVNDTLTLTVIRENECRLEIPARFHHSLVDWILFRAYQVRDADGENRSKSTEHLALFEQEFGSRSSAKDETFNNRQMPYNTSDGYY